MEIDKAIQILDNSVNNTADQKDMRFKRQLSNILHELKYKEFSTTERSHLEKELDLLFLELDLEIEPIAAELQKRLKHFLKMLRVEFQILPESYWTGRGMLFGLLTGLSLLGMLMFLTESELKYAAPLGGLFIGVISGALTDTRIRKQGRSLVTKMY